MTGAITIRLGLVDRRAGDLSSAREHIEGGLDLAREAGDRRAEAVGLRGLGLLALSEGDLETARTQCQRSLRLHRHIDDKSGAARSRGGLGLTALNAGEPGEAREFFDQTLADSRAVDNRMLSAKYRGLRGAADVALGDRRNGRSALEDAVSTLTALDAAPAAITVLRWHAEVEGDLGNYERMRERCERASTRLADTDVELGLYEERIRRLREELDQRRMAAGED